MILLTIIAAVALSGCGNDGENNAASEEAVAVVNGTEIPRSEFDQLVEQQQSLMEQQGIDFEAEENQEMLEQIEEAVLNQLIGQELVSQVLEETDYEVSDEELNEKRAEFINMFAEGDEENFNQILEQQGITQDEFDEMIAEQIELENILIERYGEIEVSDEEVDQAFDMQKELAMEQAEEAGEEVSEEDLEELKTVIHQQLRDQKLMQQQAQLIEELREENEANIEILL